MASLGRTIPKPSVGVWHSKSLLVSTANNDSVIAKIVPDRWLPYVVESVPVSRTKPIACGFSRIQRQTKRREKVRLVLNGNL